MDEELRQVAHGCSKLGRAAIIPDDVRILSILPFPALPLTHGGRVRAVELALGMARAGGHVDLACPWHPGIPRRGCQHEAVTIRPFVFAANLLPKLLGDRLVPPLFQLSLQPYTVGPRRLLAQTRLYDVVEFHFCAYAAWMKRAAAYTRVVYAAHNVELDYALQAAGSRRGSAFTRRIAALERRAVQDSHLVVTCTEADGVRLAELYGEIGRFEVVSNGFDAAELWEADPPHGHEVREELGLARDELVLLFVGGRGAQNRRAVEFLEHELLPKVHRPARLLVVGQCTRPRREGRVLALGFVDSLVPLFAAADVAVNPIQSGSGSNIKLAEYLAAGLPVVTTPVGLRGYEAFADIVTVAPLDEFAEAVQSARGLDGRRPEVAELTWTALGGRLYDIYEQLVDRVRPPALPRPG